MENTFKNFGGKIINRGNKLKENLRIKEFPSKAHWSPMDQIAEYAPI